MIVRTTLRVYFIRLINIIISIWFSTILNFPTNVFGLFFYQPKVIHESNMYKWISKGKSVTLGPLKCSPFILRQKLKELFVFSTYINPVTYYNFPQHHLTLYQTKLVYCIFKWYPTYCICFLNQKRKHLFDVVG
jgi:hypothetical protein